MAVRHSALKTQAQACLHTAVPKITVVGAGNVGANVARCILGQRLGNVVLLDVVEGRPQGLALDLSEASPFEDYSHHITGTNRYLDTQGSSVIVITAGMPRKPGMSRDDLTQVNSDIIRQVITQAVEYSPDAIIVLVTNPLDVMAYLAWKTSGLPPARVMGQAGVLDSARFRTFIAQALGVPPQQVSTMVLGGHGDLMVPLVSCTSVNGVPLSELMAPATIQQLVERTRQGGAEIVNYLKTGGAFFAPAAATTAMVAAVLQDQSAMLPVSAYLTGQFGLEDIYLGVPCRLGSGGVEAVVELPITDQERAALEASARAVRQALHRAMPVAV